MNDVDDWELTGRFQDGMTDFRWASPLGKQTENGLYVQVEVLCDGMDGVFV